MSDPNVPHGSPEQEPHQGTVQVALVLEGLKEAERAQREQQLTILTSGPLLKDYLDKLRQKVQQLCVGHGVHPLDRHPPHLLIREPVEETVRSPAQHLDGALRDIRGVQESQTVQMSRTGPLPQQSVDLRKAGPLPAGGAGQHQRQRRALRLAEGLLLPQQTPVVHRKPEDTDADRQQLTDFYWFLLVSTGFCWSLLVPTGVHLFLLVSAGFYWFLLVSTVSCWFLLAELSH